MTLGRDIEGDPSGRSLGSGVETAESRFTVYLSSDDIVALMERLDDYLGDTGLQLVTLDRTNSGQFYAFLKREFI